MQTRYQTYLRPYAPGISLKVEISDKGYDERPSSDSPGGWDGGYDPQILSAKLTVHGLTFDYLEGKPPFTDADKWLKETHPTKHQEVWEAIEDEYEVEDVIADPDREDVFRSIEAARRTHLALGSLAPKKVA